MARLTSSSKQETTSLKQEYLCQVPAQSFLDSGCLQSGHRRLDPPRHPVSRLAFLERYDTKPHTESVHAVCKQTNLPISHAVLRQHWTWMRMGSCSGFPAGTSNACIRIRHYLLPMRPDRQRRLPYLFVAPNGPEIPSRNERQQQACWMASESLDKPVGYWTGPGPLQHGNA